MDKLFSCKMKSLEVPNKTMQGGHNLVAKFRSKKDSSSSQVKVH